MEEWKEIDFSNGKYSVSNYGNVRNNHTNKELKCSIYHGYKRVTLTCDKIITRPVHILVANAFVPNPNNKPIVNHIDENKQNPHYLNLEWVTYEENANHGNRNDKIGNMRQQPVCEYGLDGKYIRTWVSPVAVSKVYNISARAIQLSASTEGMSKTSYGRQWRYYKDTLAESIEPITNTHILKYNKGVEHAEEIPSEFLFILPSENKKDKCIDMLKNISTNEYLNRYQKRYIEEIIEYIRYCG